MNKTPKDLRDLERAEILDKLTENGHGSLVEAVRGHEKDVFTQKGRLNKSGLCRVLGITVAELNAVLAECAEILEKDQ